MLLPGRRSRGVREVVEIWIEVRHLVAGFVGVRNSVPAQAEVQGQAVIDAPVVLEIEVPGDVVPVTGFLQGVFGIVVVRSQGGSPRSRSR